MAEGIKVSELIPAISVANDDLFIIDKIQTNFEYITNQIKFVDLVSSITGLDLIFTGDIDFNGDVDFNGSLNIGGSINIDGGGNIETPIVITELVKNFQYLSSSYTGAVVVLKVKVVDKDSTHRYFNEGSGRGFEIEGSMAPFFYFTPGITYQFDLSDISCLNHGLAFYYDSEKTRPFATRATPTTNTEEGVIFSGTPGQPGSYARIEIKDNTPTVLHYQSEQSDLEGNSFQCNANNLRGNRLSGLDDVSDNLAGDGQILLYNGVQWVPSNPSELAADINTDQIPEGTQNLYYTDARARQALDVVISSTEVPGGNLEYNQVTGIFTYYPAQPELANGTVTSVDMLSPQATLSISGGPITESGIFSVDLPSIITPPNSGIEYPIIQIDKYGRVISLTKGTVTDGTVTSILVRGEPGRTTVSPTIPVNTTGTFTVDLDKTTVTPGNYSKATISVDQYGRIVAASSNVDVDGTVTSVEIESPDGTINVTNGIITDAGTIKIDQGEIFGVEGTYENANIEVDKYGRVIGASAGTGAQIDVLDDIGDVNTPSPATNQVLTWNGTEWVARSLTVEGALEYNGEVDLTVPYTESPENDALPNTPASWRRGDLYINISGQGTVDSSWTGISGESVNGLERIIWSGTQWDIFMMPSENDLNLQQVTDLGAETTNTITVGGIISSGLTYPTTDGTANQVIQTDGSGNLFFGDQTGDGSGDGGLEYNGKVDLTKDYTFSPDNDSVDDNPDSWKKGDLYVNISGPGTVDTSWTGISGESVNGLERVIWDGTKWDLIADNSGGDQDLQQVTDIGAITTNSIEVGGITASGLLYPLTDGSPNQVIQTDGSGNLFFADQTGGELDDVLTYRGICDITVSYTNIVNGDVPDDPAEFIRGDVYINQGGDGETDSASDWINDGLAPDYQGIGQEFVAWTGEVDPYGGGGGWRVIGYINATTGVVGVTAQNGIEDVGTDLQQPILQADKTWFDDPDKHYVNVQGDWKEEDPNEDSYIRNKPNFDDLEDLQDLIRDGGNILQEDSDAIFGDGEAPWQDGSTQPIDHIKYDRVPMVVLSINGQAGAIETTEEWIKDNGFATRAEGELALTALQPGDVVNRVNVSELNNDAGYITQDQYNELLQLIANLQSQINNINNGTTSG